MDTEDPMPRTASKTLPLDIQRMLSIERDADTPRDGHALSPTERAAINGTLPVLEKRLMYTNSLRKRSLDLPLPGQAVA